MIIDTHSPSRPAQFVLRTLSSDALTTFYCDLFGWTLEGEGTFVLRGRTVAQMERSAGGWLPYLAVADLAVALEQVTHADAKTLSGPTNDLAGRRAVIIDAGGAPLGLWQSGSGSGVGLMVERGAVVWIEEKTRNQEAATAFLQSLFGFGLLGASGPGSVRLLKGEGPLFGGVMQFDDRWTPDEPPHWLLYFQTGDVTAMIDRAILLGGSLWFPPMDTPLGQLAYIRDPDGNAFAVVEVSEQGRAMTGAGPA